MAANLFVSHTDEDIARCAPILKTLGAWGVPCYFDAKDRRSANGLSLESQQALVESAIMLRVCTRYTGKSYWMSIEAGTYLSLQADDHRAGNDGRHKIVNLILDTSYKPEPFDVSAIAIDASNTRWPGWVNDLRRALDLPPIADIATVATEINPPPAKRMSRRTVVGLGAAGAVALAAGIAGGAALARHGGASTVAKKPPSTDPRLRWWYDAANTALDSSETAVITAAPVIEGNVVYIATLQAQTHALSLDGKKLWQVDLPSTAAIYQTPAVANGAMYVSATGSGIYAIRNGAQLWFDRRDTSSFTTTLIAQNKLFVNALQYFAFVDGLDLATGASALQLELEPYAIPLSGIALAGDMLYIGCADGYLYAHDLTTSTTPRWKADVGAARQATENVTNTYYVNSTPIVADGVVYAASNDGSVYAFDAATGARRWTFATKGSIDILPPALAEGVLYVSSRHDALYALDAQTGKPVWSHAMGSGLISPPMVAQGEVYVGSHDQAVHALDARTGAPRYTYATAASVRAQPVVAGSTLYVADVQGYVYAFTLG